MPRPLFALASLVLLSAAAPSATKPLIYRNKSTGHVMASYSRTERCELHSNRVVILRSSGNVSTSETRMVTFVPGSVAELKGLTAAAKAGLIKTHEPRIADAPETIWALGDDTVLKHVAMTDMVMEENMAASVPTLINLLDSHCP